MNAEFLTYHDIALKVQVDPKTISRLVCRLEKLKLVAPYRPTKGIVRLSPTDVKIVLQHHHA